MAQPGGSPSEASFGDVAADTKKAASAARRAKLRAGNLFQAEVKTIGGSKEEEAAAAEREAQRAKREERRDRLKNKNQTRHAHEGEIKKVGGKQGEASSASPQPSVSGGDPLAEGQFTVNLAAGTEHGLTFAKTSTAEAKVIISSSSEDGACYRQGVRPGDVLCTVGALKVLGAADDDIGAALQQRPTSLTFEAGKLDNDRDMTVPAEAESIGLGLGSLPPDVVTLAMVNPGSWGQTSGLLAGDEVRLVGGLPAVGLTASDLKAGLRRRPLRLRLRLLREQLRDFTIAAPASDADKLPLGLKVNFVASSASLDLTGVEPNSWAAQAGLQSGDEIVAVQGSDCSSLSNGAQFGELLEKRPLSLKLRLKLGVPPAAGTPMTATPATPAAPSAQPARSSFLSDHGELDYYAATSPSMTGSRQRQQLATTPEEVTKDLHLDLPDENDLLLYPNLDPAAVASIAASPNIVSPNKGTLKMALKLSAKEQQSAMIFPVSGIGGSSFNFAPSVALKMLPDLNSGADKWQAFARGASTRPAVSLGAFQPHPARAAVAGADFYEQAWQRQSQKIGTGPPHVKISISYEQMVSQRLGPLASNPEATMSAQEYQHDLLTSSGALGYQVLQQGVELPRSQPNYMNMLTSLHAEDGEELSMEELQQALDENVRIREQIQSDCLGMLSKLPKKRGSAVIDENGVIEMGQTQAPETEYYKISVKVKIFKATGLPAPDFMYTRSPFVIVSVLDGDPLSPAAQADGNQQQADDWYNEREQLHRKTAIIGDTQNPEWDCTITGEVRPRDGTVVHLRVMDHQEYAHKDTPVGQAIIPLSEVMNNQWTAIRSLALIPFDRKNSARWAELDESRMIVSITWEGLASQVKTPTVKFGDTTGTSSKAHDRLAARKRGKEQSPQGEAEPAKGSDEPPSDFGQAAEPGASSRDRLAARRDRKKKQQEAAATAAAAGGEAAEETGQTSAAAEHAEPEPDGYGGDTGVWG